jgi:cyclopropane fatty-acyl-phospholipid synthase-like methyltransferase
MIPKDYNDNFYDYHFQDSINSAQELIPLFLKYFKPKSVLDVGCGLGTWLSVFEEYNCEIFGIDGDNVDIKKLIIHKNKFKPLDLNLSYNLNKKFDLVISLEVAEHILPENAEIFIDSICSHSDIVLFSAAIPGQEGTMHYNEQNNEYWEEKFNKNEYQCIDFFRHKIWNNKEISWWYRQNILIFIKKSEINNPKYMLIVKEISNNLNTYIHPELFRYKSLKANKIEKILNSPVDILKYYLRKKRI